MNAGRTIAATNKAIPPTTAAPFEELESTVFDAANAPTDEITIIASVATDLTKPFILYFFIVLKMISSFQFISQSK